MGLLSPMRRSDARGHRAVEPWHVQRFLPEVCAAALLRPAQKKLQAGPDFAVRSSELWENADGQAGND